MPDFLHIAHGALEIRQEGGARVLRGRFPYGGKPAVLADRGNVRKESIASRAFNFAIEQEPERRIDLLVGHDFGKPIASRQSGTLKIVDDVDAVTFEATLPTNPPSWVVDAERAIAAGLMVGLSPGFRVPPRAVIPDAESLIPEQGNPGVSIRLIRAAVLREFSVVTNPAYEDAFVDLRAEDTGVLTRAPEATLWL